MPTVHLESLDQAIEFCKFFKDNSDSVLFRGQAGPWPIISSLGRIVHDESLMEIEKDKYKLFKRVIANNIELSYLKGDVNRFYAVAQHYGLKTNYIDFSTDYNVAAFFATHSQSLTKGDQCSISILDLNKFDEHTSLLQESNMISKEEDRYPEIVSVEVENLWRLQAQKGKFLYTPIVNIDEIYDVVFTKLFFHFDKPFMGLSASDIYPVEKSQLETSLDQYFFLEHKKDRMNKFFELLSQGNTGFNKLSYVESPLGYIEEHHSWSNFVAHHIDENWYDVRAEQNISLNLSEQFNLQELEIKLEHILSKKQLGKSYTWNIHLADEYQPFSQVVTSTWEGIRLLPKTLKEKIVCLSRLIYLNLQYCFKQKNSEFYLQKHVFIKEALDDPIGVEIVNKDESYCRSYISSQLLYGCLRSDIGKYYDIGSSKGLTSLLLQNDNARQIFDKAKLDFLFITEILPVVQTLSSNLTFFTLNNIEKLGLK